MQKVILLTQEEYDDLLVVKQEPDTILRETNTALKTKLDACNKKLQQGAFDNSRVDTPFIVTNNKLHLRSPNDFILMYNSLAMANFKQSDEALFNSLNNISKLFNYEQYFNSISEVKAYRVSLQKKKIILGKVLVNGRLQLTTKDK